MNQAARRLSFVFLCALPFLMVAVVAIRALRIPGVYQPVGVALFGVTAAAAWILGARAIVAGKRRLALAGILLLLPSAINSLLWVGLGAPFQATAEENGMRYLVLLANSVVIASAFVALKEELCDAGERFYSTIGFAAGIPAGTTYIVCMGIAVSEHAARSGGADASSAQLLSNLFDVLEFVACLLTYIATAAFATSLGQAGWLGRGAARAYTILSIVLCLFLVARGVSYPEISGNTAPWYTRPGVVAGIPAVPWIMPCLLGVVLLRRAGGEQQARQPA